MKEFTNESGIYICSCLPNGYSYVGQAQSLSKRKQQHISSLRNNNHHNKHLQRAWNKYGEENFSWEILELCSVDCLNEREQYWIDKYDSFNNGFNQTLGGDGLRGYCCSDETKKKHAIASERMWTPERRQEQRDKMLGSSNPMSGKVGELNPAYGQDHSGVKNAMYGKHHTEEANEKNRQAHLGKNNKNAKPIICIETNELFWSMGEAGRNKNCADTTICKCCKGVKKTCGGYHWRYATEEEIEQYNQNQINNIAS